MAEVLEFPQNDVARRGGVLDLIIGAGLLYLVAPRIKDAVATTAVSGGTFDVMAIQLWAAMGLLGIGMVVIGLGRLRPKPPPVVRLFGDRLEAKVPIPLTDIRAWLFEPDGGGRLMVAHRDQILVLDGRAFKPGELARLYGALKMRLGTRTAELDAQGARSLSALERPAHATRIALVAVALGFAAELIAGRVAGPAGSFDMVLVRLGAAVPTLIGDGEWDRLLTASVLHGGLLHIGINGIALHGLGGLLERLVGPIRLTIIYLFACLVGAASSALSTEALMSVGASTGIFGLLGAFAVVHWRHADHLPLGFRQTRRWWFFIVGLNVALPMLVPVIDGMAHLGGFIVGAGLTLLLTERPEDLEAPPASVGLQLTAAGIAGLFLVGFGVSAHRALVADEAMLIDAMDRIVAATPVDEVGRETLNNMAWYRVVDPEASPAWLEAAARTAGKASTGAGEDEVNVIDTYATALHRIGERRRAAVQMRRVMDWRRDAFTATQMARMLDAEDTVIRVQDAPVPTLNVTNLGQTVTAKLVGPAVRAYAVVRLGETRMGLLEATIPTNGGVLPSPAVALGAKDWSVVRLDTALPKGTRLQVLWTEPSTEEEPMWTWWPTQADADALP